MSVRDGRLNVNGTPLRTCSLPGMPVTGYVRDGFCGAHGGDAGKHNVCMDISDVSGGATNFCAVTGQPDWCGGKRNWCVCQWAFESAVERVGCENVTVKCDATHEQALRDYERRPGAALACLRQKCGLGGR